MNMDQYSYFKHEMNYINPQNMDVDQYQSQIKKFVASKRNSSSMTSVQNTDS